MVCNLQASSVERGLATRIRYNLALMRTSQKGCVFCGGTPLTKEHIWSDWLDSILPRADSSRSEARRTTMAEKVVGGRPTYLPTSNSNRVRQGAVHSTTSRTVCKRCNNGWMKEIVDRAKPVATEVIQLRQTALLPEAQTRLATWLVLSAVMRDQKATAHPQKIQPAVRHLLTSTNVRGRASCGSVCGYRRLRRSAVCR